jgi:phosphoglycerate dehydrogenase-like enzyme
VTPLVEGDRPWVLTVLAPIDTPTAVRLFTGLPVDVRMPDGPMKLADALADTEIVVGDWRIANPGLTAEVIATAGKLAFVQQPSVGFQAHDLEALAEAGVPISNSAGFNSVAVAEWVLGALFSLARQISWASAEMVDGRWPQTDIIGKGATEVAGLRVGLVGFGHIAQALAGRFAALGCPVSYWSRSEKSPEQEQGATFRELDEVLADSQVLVNLLPLSAQTRGLLSADRLARLPAGAFLISASRGGIVDEQAAIGALEAGRLAGAAFDVYDVEPLPSDSPLRHAPNVLLSPHAAGSTVQSMGRLMASVTDNVTRAVTGSPVIDVVNGADPVIRRR